MPERIDCDKSIESRKWKTRNSYPASCTVTNVTLPAVNAPAPAERTVPTSFPAEIVVHGKVSAAMNSSWNWLSSSSSQASLPYGRLYQRELEEWKQEE